MKILKYLTTTEITNSVSALIRQFWTASLPNTAEKVQNTSKVLTPSCNLNKELCHALEQRIDSEFAEYEDAMLERSPAYIFAECAEINAMCTCYNLLTIKLVQADDVQSIEYLARFKRPLKVVCNEWMKRGGNYGEVFDTMLQELAETGSAEISSDFDPDWVEKHCSPTLR